MAVGKDSPRPAEYPHKPVASLDRTDGRTRLIGPASAIHLARCDAGYPHLRTFGAKDRSVAIPNERRCALEGLTCWNNFGCGRHVRWWEEIPADHGDHELREGAHRFSTSC
jgi:hypothetical protein